MDTNIEMKKESVWRSLMGPLTSRDFWLSLGRDMVVAMCGGFFAALGGVLSKYAASKLGTNQVQIGQPEPTTVSNRAFGNGYQPSPTYASSYTPPVPTHGDQRFPGLR